MSEESTPPGITINIHGQVNVSFGNNGWGAVQGNNNSVLNNSNSRDNSWGNFVHGDFVTNNSSDCTRPPADKEEDISIDNKEWRIFANVLNAIARQDIPEEEKLKKLCEAFPNLPDILKIRG